jgi:hypothetical protein
MSGGGPPGTFAIVRYGHAPGPGHHYKKDTTYVLVTEAHRAEIAGILGITGSERQRLSNGTVYIHPEPTAHTP